MCRRPVMSVFLALSVLSGLLASTPARAEVTTLTLGVNKPSPQQVGTAVTFTATASGVGLFEYKFWVAKGAGAYVPVSLDYVTERTMLWTPTEADGYKVRVYARTQGSTVPFEKSAVRSGYYVVAEAPLTAVSLGASKASPQKVGTALTFTAAASGAGGAGAEYQFLLAKGGGPPLVVKEYAEPGNTWSPGVGDMDVADSYLVQVNARNVGSIAPFEKYATKTYVMMANAPVKSVTLSADKPSPQDLATIGTVTFTAAATPGVPGAPLEYQFWLYTTASGIYTAVGDVTSGYSAAKIWHWTPTVKDNYKVMVYARTVGGTVAYEKLKVLFYTVFTDPPGLGDVTPSIHASPAGSAQTFSAVYSDSEGYEGLKTASILINETAAEANGIFVRHDRSNGKLYLLNDAGTAYVGNCLPGSAASLTNSQGTLNCLLTSVGGSGNDLTIDWSITPKLAFASTTAKNVYTHVKDNSNVQVGWFDKGDWTVTLGVDLADCEGCHGNPPHVGSDGLPGTADDAPNVLGNGVNPAGVGGTPKPNDDGTYGYNVNGHGANGTAPHAPLEYVSGNPPRYVAYLTPNLACDACHDIAQPAAGAGRHLNGILNSVDAKLNPSENTAHLRTDGAYPFIVSGSNAWDVQIGFDSACYLRCHASAAVANMRHASDAFPVANAVRFGEALTFANGEGVSYPIDSALTTNASAAPEDFAPCISCHNPHGTSVVEPTLTMNRMVRANYRNPSTLCLVCHY
jgi:hypothetical protein